MPSLKFTNRGSNQSKGIRNETNPINYVTFPSNSHFLTPPNQCEILKINNNLKLACSGRDDIDPNIIEQISMLIEVPLSHIINCSLMTGVATYNLKIAKVIPI